MGELPSKYSSTGLSASEQRRTLTVGAPRANRPVGAIKIEERVHDALSHEKPHITRTITPKKNGREGSPSHEDPEGDIPMVGMDTEEEVQIIAEYVTDKRERDQQFIQHVPSFSYDDDFSDPPVLPELARETYMVVDTNFMISHLDIIDKLAKLHKSYHHRIVIPVTVVKELDGLKESRKSNTGSIDGVTVGHLARWANDWTYTKLANMEPSVRGQKMREKLDRDALKDDSILDCCLYLKEKEGALVILMSNDKNLCMKALTNDIPTVSYRKDMTAELIAQMAFQENKSRPVESHEYETDNVIHPAPNDFDPEDAMVDDTYGSEHITMAQPSLPHSKPPSRLPSRPPSPIKRYKKSPKLSPPPPSDLNFDGAVRQVYSEVQKIVLDAIDYCMWEEYGDDMELIGYHKSAVITLSDAANVLIKYWVSVFTEYFEHAPSKPFPGRGKKTPRYVRHPTNPSEFEQFVSYWGNVLRALYVKRDDKQNEALEHILLRWAGFTKVSAF